MVLSHSCIEVILKEFTDYNKQGHIKEDHPFQIQNKLFKGSLFKEHVPNDLDVRFDFQYM